MNVRDLLQLDQAQMSADKEEILSLLRKMGLSDYEAKAYLALVMRSHGSAEDVAEAAEIPRTSAYKVLDSLIAKSFVTGRGGRPAVFQPVPPLEIKDRLAADMDRILRKLDSLKGSLSERGTPQLVYTITGKEKVLAKIGEMLDLAQERFFISSPSFIDINSVYATKFINAVKRGVVITVVAEPSARVPDATEVIRKQDLLATDVITDSDLAMIAAPDLSICGFTDNPFLAAHLDNFFQMALEKAENGQR